MSRVAELRDLDNYVECLCGKRFVGGDLVSRLLRWRSHLDDCPRDA